jgi:hypothetical protein
MEGTTKCADLYEEMKKMLQSLDNPVVKPAALVSNGNRSMSDTNSVVS